MRCLQIASGDLWAGAEVSTYNLVVALLRRPEVEVRCLLLNHGMLAERLRAAGSRVSVLPERELGFTGLLRAARSSLRHFRPDVIHTHRYKENLLGSALCALSGACHVRTAHGLPPALEWNGRLRGVGALLDRALASWSGSTWIAVSSDLAARVGSLRDRIHVVPNGLPERAPEPDRSALCEAFGDDVPAWYLGFAGRLEEVKRPDRFLRILASLPREVSKRKVRGVILGDGSLREETERLVAALGLGEKVRLLGHRENGENLVAAFDALLIPSDHEGHPMVLLEAMRSSVPVVAARVGGIPDVIDDARFVFPPEDESGMMRAVVRLFEDAATRGSWAGMLQHRFQAAYRVEQMAARVLDVYRSCQL